MAGCVSVARCEKDNTSQTIFYPSHSVPSFRRFLRDAKQKKTDRERERGKERNKRRGIGDSKRNIKMAMNLKVKLKHVYDLTFAQMAEFESMRTSEQNKRTSDVDWRLCSKSMR